jgi:sulfate/thiosulfate transport system permease protein
MRRSVIPGFSTALGITATYLGLIVLLPLAALAMKTAELGLDQFLAITTNPRALAAYRVTLLTALGATLINAVYGLALAWVLVRYEFPGRRVVDAIIDLPFALPTAVAGVALTAICAPNGLAGRAAAEFGVKLAFTPAGVFIALLFIGLPFVVRTVEPVLADLEPELEEAAALLGASRWRAVTRVVLPALAPAAAAGLALAFARAVGEYGSVIFIAGNMPLVSEIAPLLIVVQLEEYDYGAATAIAAVMLAASLVLLAIGAVLQRRLEREEAR